MDIAFWCVLVAGILPIACTAVAKYGRFEERPNGRFDNNNPRAWLATQSGVRKRANDAQANSWEAFPFFAAGVIIAYLQDVDIGRIDMLALVFIVARLVYIWLYISDRASLRSLVWAIGWLASIGLYVLAATGSTA